MSPRVNRSAILIIAVSTLLVFAERPACGADPFFNYPAYGAQRGKIVNRSGPFVDRQRIRWGNGVTANGVAVFHDFFAAAVPIATAFAGREADPDRSRQAQQQRESHARDLDVDTQLLVRAQATFNATQLLAQQFGVAGPALGPTESGSPIPAGFENWDNTGNAPAVNVGAAGTDLNNGNNTPGGNRPVVDLKSWDNTGKKKK